MSFSSRSASAAFAAGFALPPPPPPPPQAFSKEQTAIHIVSNKHQVFRLMLNDAADYKGYEVMNREILIDSLKFEPTKNTSAFKISASNNPERYTFELKGDTLYLFQDLSLPNRQQPQHQDLPFPFAEDVTTIRVIDVYPRLETLDQVRASAMPAGRSFV